MTVTDIEYLNICRKRMITLNSSEYKNVKLRADRYGVTARDLILLWDQQDGKCAICKEELVWLRDNKSRHGVVDHSHSTGNVRGWLCHPCNIRVGHIERKSSEQLLRLLETPGLWASQLAFKGLLQHQFEAMVVYVFQNANMATSLEPAKQVHNVTAEKFLTIQTKPSFYEFKNPSDGERSLLLRWMKNKGIQGQLFKSADISAIDAIWLAKIDTTDEKRLAFEERFVRKEI